MRQHWVDAIAAANMDESPPPALARLQRDLAKANAEGGLKKKEIDQAAPLSTYSVQGEDHQCAICLDDIEAGAEIRTLPCGHFFKAPCVETWIARANRCPVCNAPLVDKKSEPVKEAYTAPLRRGRRNRGTDGRFSLGNLSPGRTNQEDTSSDNPTNDSVSTSNPPTGDVVLDIDSVPAAPSVIINLSEKK